MYNHFIVADVLESAISYLATRDKETETSREKEKEEGKEKHVCVGGWCWCMYGCGD